MMMTTSNSLLVIWISSRSFLRLSSINASIVKITVTGCKVERMLAGAEAPAAFQFLRLGYFAVDNKDSTPEHPVFNRAVALKDSFKNQKQPPD